MWNLIPRKLMPPTRVVRYCCEALKESGGDGRLVVTGVRWAESSNRKANQGAVTVMGKSAANQIDSPDFLPTKRGGVILTNDNEESRRVVEQCYKRHETTVNPIIEWEDRDVWDFIQSEGIPYCGLYDEGYTRLGCIACPMAGTRDRSDEFRRWPKYKDAYMRAFQKMLDRRRELGRETAKWNNATDVFNWWMNFNVLPGQIDLFEEEMDEY